MIETTQEFTPPAAVLVAVDCGDYDVSASLDELSELAKSADIRPVSRIIQKRSSPDTATCIGSGRLVELKQLCEADGRRSSSLTVSSRPPSFATWKRTRAFASSTGPC